MVLPSIALIVPCVPLDLDNLLALLRQVAAGTDRPDEVIVALSDTKHASHDALAHVEQFIAQSALNVTLLRREAPALAGDNRNFAIAAARSDVIVCHDADDAIHPQKIAMLRHWFEKRPDVMLMVHWLQPYGYEWQWCDDFDSVPIADVDKMRDVDFGAYRRPIQRGHAAFRREPVAECVSFPDNYVYGEDLRFLIDAHRQFRYTLVLEWPLCKYDDVDTMPDILKERWNSWPAKEEPNGLLRNRVKCTWEQRADDLDRGDVPRLSSRDNNDDGSTKTEANTHAEDADEPTCEPHWPALAYVERGRYLLPYEGACYRRYALDMQWFERVMALPRGITFMVRAKNEQDSIVECIETLRRAFDGHEPALAYNIVLIDNGSGDDTVRRALPLLRPDRGDLCVSYALQVCKPGVESYVTPCNSAHSLPWFYQWCAQRCERYSHIFKWDADFRMSEPLADTLRSHFAGRFRLPADLYNILSLGNDGRSHRECYCIALRLRYRYILMRLWETWQTYCTLPTETLDDTACILHASSLHDVPKPHLLFEPWWNVADVQAQPFANQAWLKYVKAQFNYWKRRLPRGAPTYTRATDNSCQLLEQTLPYRELSIEGLPVP